MKFLAAVFFFLLLLSCCGDPNAENGVDDPSKRNENWAWFVDSATGKGAWLPAGDSASMITGDYMLFFCNGKIRKTGKLIDGRDADTMFYYDTAGKLISKRYITPEGQKEIMPDGKYRSFYATCELSSEGEVRNNKIIGKRTEYFRSGKPKIVSFTTGDTTRFQRYYESGLPEDSFMLISGRKYGLAKKWYANGKIEAEVFLIDDKENGSYITYYENGNKKTEYMFRDGKEEGLCMQYYEDGKLKGKVNYRNGQRHGEFWLYHPNGKLKVHGFSENGTMTSGAKYDENGNMTKEKKDPG